MKPFKQRDILSIEEFSKEELLHLLEVAKEQKKGARRKSLEGKILASCFFEPSTRTRLSFESAVKRLGGDVIGFADGNVTSARKGESLKDSIKVIGSYCDVIVLRHPLEGSSRFASEVTETPIINAGDGSNEHPTQTFTDLFTILEAQGKLEGLSIAFAGDLKYGRTVHSLALALKFFGGRIYFVSPPNLTIPDKIAQSLKEMGIPFSSHQTIDEVIKKVDILYMTRVQEERFTDRYEYESVKNSTSLKKEHLNGVRENFKVLHPLPRVNEIEEAIDQTPQALYFQQAQNGLYVREALLHLILG